MPQICAYESFDACPLFYDNESPYTLPTTQGIVELYICVTFIYLRTEYGTAIVPDLSICLTDYGSVIQNYVSVTGGPIKLVKH